MKRPKYLLYFILLTITIVINDNIYAQQDPLFSQYMFSGIYLNPAKAGTTGNTETVLMYREQWSQVASNPTSMLLNINTPIDHNRIGIGGQILNTSFNEFKMTQFNLSGSYKINIGKNKLSMGLEAGTRYYSISYDDLKIKDPGDRVIQNVKSKLLPDISAGLYYYCKKSFIGISCKHLNQGNVRFDGSAADFKLAHHYYLTGGTQFKVSEHTTLKPMFLVKYYYQTPVQADISLIGDFHNAFWAGINIRSSKEAGVLLGVVPNKIISAMGEQWKLGCAFDYGFNRLSVNNNAASYELVINYNFKARPKPDQIKKKSKIISPMLFGNSLTH